MMKSEITLIQANEHLEGLLLDIDLKNRWPTNR